MATRETKQLVSSPDLTPPPSYDMHCKKGYLGADTCLSKEKGGGQVEIDMYLSKGPKTLDSDESGSSDNSDAPTDGSFLSKMTLVHNQFSKVLTDNKSFAIKALLAGLVALYMGYFIWAVYVAAVKKCTDVVPLLILTVVCLFLVVVHFISTRFEEEIEANILRPLKNFIRRNETCLFRFQMAAAIALMIAILIYATFHQPSNLVSVCGILFFLIISWVASAHPTQVKLRPVIGGLMMQFFLAAFILKTDVGYTIFAFFGKQIQTFLGYTDYGSAFVFGKDYIRHFFAFKVLSVIVFFSSVVSMLYYLGVMQMVISKIAFIMRLILGTTAAESLVAAGNIFIGQTEAPILVRPYLDLMTKSELTSIMTCGFATIAGAVLAAYISYGVPAEHLLCASVMNACGGLAISKLVFPETEESQLIDINSDTSEKKERNIIEAAAAGASQSIKLVANIAANLIAFLALLAFVNAAMGWFGSFVCHPELRFQHLAGYFFMPVAYLMGVPWEDCDKVGELIGLKTFINEFIAYMDLAEMIKNRKECGDARSLSVRSEIIATYALCGFSNLSSIGIQLGGLGSMCPSRKGDLATLVIRALFAGIVTCLLTASIAGLLIVEIPFVPLCIGNTTLTNITMIDNSTLINGTSIYNLTSNTALL